MQTLNGKIYMDLSACVWTFGGGSGGFNRSSRSGMDEFTTAEKLFLIHAVNKVYIQKHPEEPLAISGFEAHVPNELTKYAKNFERTPKGEIINSLEPVRIAMAKTGLLCAMVTPNSHHFSMYRAATSADPKERALAKARLEEAFEIALALGAKTVVLWNGGEVYSSPFEVDFKQMISAYIDTLRIAADLAIKNDMYIAIEPKPFEPGDEMFPNNSGLLMALLNYARDKKLLTEDQYARLGVNDEMGHVKMGNMDLAQTYAINAFGGKNFHAHLNRQNERGKHDTDNEIEMDIDSLAVIDILSTDSVFMDASVRRFAGFDYKFRHQYNGKQAILSLYANIARTRAMEQLAREIRADLHIKKLREEHKYVELNSAIKERLGKATAKVEKEISEVGKEGGIPIPKDYETRVSQSAL
ncbi:MAG: TIM barrel protein [archaeon]